MIQDQEPNRSQEDRLPFLQAIQADPDNDALAFIYADWLEERGEFDRAEFLRLETELAGLGWRDDRRTELTLKRERWSETQLEEWRRTEAPSPRLLPQYAPFPTFRKGLIRSLSVEQSQTFRESLELERNVLHILELSAIHELRISDPGLFKKLPRSLILNRITSLDLALPAPPLRLPPLVSVRPLLESPHARGLRSLACNLEAIPDPRSNAWMSGLDLPHLRRLRLRPGRSTEDRREEKARLLAFVD